MVVPAFVAMSRPWLVAWSLSTLIDAPDTPAQQAAAEELSLLMRFRADHFDALFDFAGAGDTHANDHAARVGVLTSWRNNAVLQPANASGSGKLQVRPPAKSLRALGVDYRFETAKTIGFGPMLATINSFLQHTTQSTRVEHHLSESLENEHGTPL